jgi:hypothetical protein
MEHPFVLTYGLTAARAQGVQTSAAISTTVGGIHDDFQSP